ncbi:MAG: hypothetical protein J7466_19485 [Roseiflexus sp.]|nr:hypothetical protein [Roseiflexus sp.]
MIIALLAARCAFHGCGAARAASESAAGAGCRVVAAPMLRPIICPRWYHMVHTLPAFVSSPARRMQALPH